MRDSEKNLAEVKIDNAHYSPFTHPANHVITQGYQMGQALFPLGIHFDYSW